ncbi:MAG: CpsD/CapB family tyrosine-protein kinase [Lachnospiraceae bacterium]|nr:CpsD/CapB family tyrosine-protein kinase [Lachnospiraceae bacterium]
MGLFFRKSGKKSPVGGENEFLLTEESGFAVQEAYKALRTNVIFSLPGSGSKCIGVTSATKGNGKSTNILNMAISFGQIGKKVIVLDGDMRLPTVASKLNIKAVPGLSNILVGSAVPEECIQHVEACNIDVIPSGIIPPDTTVLLQSSQMEKLIAQLKEIYDYIFIDLPPVLVAIDAVLISHLIDGFLIVVKHGESEYRSVSAMLNQLKYANAHILGAIYANADLGGKRKSYSHHKYYQYGDSYEKH